MKKKLAALMLSFCLCLSLASCGSGGDSQPKESTPPAADSASSQGLDVEQNLFDVTLTIPSTFIDEGTTQESLDAAAKEAGYKSATLNEDGSVTYVMTHSQHSEIMEGIRAEIDNGLAEMAGADEGSTITEVTANGDYTEFTVKTTAAELGLTESLSVLGLYLYGGMYNAFNGTPVDDIAVKFVNADTGELIQEAHSSEMGQ